MILGMKVDILVEFVMIQKVFFEWDNWKFIHFTMDYSDNFIYEHIRHSTSYFSNNLINTFMHKRPK